MFTRSDEYITKLTLEALNKEVYLDSLVTIVYADGRLRAWCEETRTWLQFPNALRHSGAKYYADIIKVQRGSGDRVFFRAATNSIRDASRGKTSDPVA